MTYAEEKHLKDTGWKIYAKANGKKSWQSPHDGRVYSSAHALLAQQVAEDEVTKEKHIQAILGNDPGFADMEKYANWEVDVDDLWPPPKKKRSLKKHKKPSKKSRKKNISDLGFE